MDGRLLPGREARRRQNPAYRPTRPPPPLLPRGGSSETLPADRGALAGDVISPRSERSLLVGHGVAVALPEPLPSAGQCGEGLFPGVRGRVAPFRRVRPVAVGSV